MFKNRSVARLIGVSVALAIVAGACGGSDDASGGSGDGTEPPLASSDGTDASDASDASAGGCNNADSGELETVTLQLDWVPNTNHTGFFVADELGYFADAGIELEILPYSGGNGDTIVAEGLADFAISFQNSITLSQPAGVDITTVAAVVQHTAEAIGIKADRDDIQSPADLDGKLYAGFGGPFEVPVMKAVIQADGGTGEFESVVLDTAAYEAVYNGSADFVIPFKTWEGIEAELTGEPMRYFEYVDYGLPDQYSVIVVANPGWLSGNEDLAKCFLGALRKGFEYGAANPAEASQILIDANPGVFNNTELVTQSQDLMANEFLLDDSGSWGCIDGEKFAAYSNFLYESNIVVGEDGSPLAEEPDWSALYDMSYLGC